jgi:CheY-like chemotaxis protein
LDDEQGRRVLVVEDEAMVAMLVEDMLTELGHSVVGPAMRLDQALPLAREAEFDFAILDVNLGGQLSFPVAEVLRARGIPFIFATGYGRNGVEEAYRDTITLMKPFERSDVQRAFAHTLARRV